VIRASNAVAAVAAKEEVDLEFREFNLNELRYVLAESARIAHRPGPRTLTARHVADATDRVGRGYLWRACEMMLRDGGRLYLEFLVRRGEGDSFARRNHVRALPVDRVVAELEGRGATVVARRVREVEKDPDSGAQGRRIGRLVVEWQR
jgi:hypothetical protein